MIPMLGRSTIVALMLALVGIACAPPALDADHASSSSAQSGDDDDDDDTSDDDDDDTAGSKAKPSTGAGTASSSSSSSGGTAASVPATFKAVYDSLKPTCASCHLSGAGGAPVFFGDTAATSYTTFKDFGLASNPSDLSSKGAHSGPALTAAQDSAVKAWVATEK